MRIASAAATFLLLSLAAPAAAQEDTDTEAPAGSGLAISGEVNLLSDFRFRGISRSDEDPAVQAALTLSVPGGFYVGGRGTSLKDAGDLESVQLDLYAGYGAELGGGTSFDAGLMYFVFPDGTGSTNYFEPYASVSHLLGPVQATLGAKYAPEQDAIGGEDLLYLFGEVEASIPLTPLTFTAQAGRQDVGAFGDYWTWSLGARGNIGPFQAAVRYVDTDLPAVPNADAGLVFSLGVRF
jgi:uncharacterized protein (TIGR02001 family)